MKRLNSEVWILKSVNDIYCTKNNFTKEVTHNARLRYYNPSTMEFINEYIPFEGLIDRVIGFGYRKSHVGDDIVSSNLGKEVFIIDVDSDDLVDQVSEPLIFLLNGRIKDESIRKTKMDSLNEALKAIQHDYNTLWCNYISLRNTGDSNIDYFLVPCYEIFRYFFLRSVKLATILLGGLTSKNEKYNKMIDGLYQRISDEILVEEGRRVGSLLVQRKLNERDVLAVGRIAYQENGFKSLETLRESCALMKFDENEPKNNKRTLSTIIPLDEPFRVSLCGEPLRYDGINYLLVNQIGDTIEQLPYDDLYWLPIQDHRKKLGSFSNDKLNGEGRRVTKATNGARAHADHRGNADEADDLEIVIPNFHSFPDNNKTVAIKLDKSVDGKRESRVPVSNVEQTLISILIGFDPNGKGGRGNASIDYESINPRRIAFFNALKLLNNFKIAYFDRADGETLTIHSDYRYIRHAPPMHNIMLCVLKVDNHHTYIIRGDTTENSVDRYAIFSDSNGAKIEAVTLNSLINLSIENGVGENKDERFLGKVDYYHRHNQGDHERKFRRILFDGIGKAFSAGGLTLPFTYFPTN